ncbi:MAG: cadherin-like beta sandwich domain-containing protein [Treponema sp.]|jgi:hypothetical protein|nr:cadherin-like beta sandwich domain-containing protein [Treponema sp.]
MKRYLVVGLFPLLLLCCDKFDVSFGDEITALTAAGDKYSDYSVEGTLGSTFVMNGSTISVLPKTTREDMNLSAPKLSVKILNPGPNHRLILGGLTGIDIPAPSDPINDSDLTFYPDDPDYPDGTGYIIASDASPTMLLVPLGEGESGQATVTAHVAVIARGATGAANIEFISHYKPQVITWDSFDPNLQSLALTGTAAPLSFTPDATDHETSIDRDTETIVIAAEAAPGALISDGTNPPANILNETYTIPPDATFALTVTAENKVTKKTYTIMVRPILSDDTALDLQVTNGSWSGAAPAFTIDHDGSGQLLTVQPVVQGPGRDPALNPGARCVLTTASGIPLTPVNGGTYPLNRGVYDLLLTVIAEDGTTTATSTLHVNNAVTSSTPPPDFGTVTTVNAVAQTTEPVQVHWIANETVEIAVSGSFASYQWRLNGVLLSETSAVLTTTARAVGGIGTHTITIRATNAGGQSYAKNIAIQVQ